jgi:hypothetical protein
MIKQVWKYELKMGRNIIEIPVDFIPLTVQVQNNTPVMWVFVDPNNFNTNRIFYVIGTGQPIELDNENDLEYVGTFQILRDEVYHVFMENIK